jgi:hypothetical protein
VVRVERRDELQFQAKVASRTWARRRQAVKPLALHPYSGAFISNDVPRKMRQGTVAGGQQFS